MKKSFKKEAQWSAKVIDLLKKGVRMTAPFSVEVGDEVNTAKISASTTIYGASRIYGRDTFIAENVKLGDEAPVTVIDCQVGSDVELRGGYFAESVFLNHAVLGSGAQIRPGCLLEEESGVNHCVGMKQTILFPFVQLGSLINFCDCLMAGGTSRKNHSEVGSSYIHFNYTPHQDKATASLIGDVPRGVMLREPPIFLGGQGGIVGPLKIDFGTVIPAGVICRHDCLKRRTFPTNSFFLKHSQPVAGVQGDISRKVQRNIEYIANLIALQQWYSHVRQNFFSKKQQELYRGATKIIDQAIWERINHLHIFEEKLREAVAEKRKNVLSEFLNTQKLFINHWPHAEDFLLNCHVEKIGQKDRDTFLNTISGLSTQKVSYLEAIRMLTTQQTQTGTRWLKAITHHITLTSLSRLGLFRQTKK
jgi:UDP-N-acetylglucosamine/UDP-N-acetylgalactosamine diphosphorylase